MPFYAVARATVQMGFSRDFEELCAVVGKGDGKSPALDKLKVVLENICAA